MAFSHPVRSSTSNWLATNRSGSWRVSVGSLYQYFPNKAAILFRLQADEWRRTVALLTRIIGDQAFPPFDRLRRLIHAFLLSECEEAAVRRALADAAPLYRDAPEAIEAKAGSERIFREFLVEALPHASEAQQHLSGDLIKRTLSQVGASFSETPRQPAEIEAYAGAMADMLCGYLEKLR